MRCYYILIHGKLDWQGTPQGDGEVSQPIGFYCHRYLLASNKPEAAEKAFRRVRANLNDWLGEGGPKLDLGAEEIAEAPIYKLLLPENRGHTFYAEE
jgi:hypothetical protein